MKGRGKSIRYQHERGFGLRSRCDGGKKKYLSEAEAEFSAEYSPVELRVYKCMDHWHLTSRV